MNFAFIPNVPLFLKGRGKGEAFYDAPVNLGLQPIKLLALEPFEVKHQCCPNPIEQQVCVFSGGDALAYIGGFDVHIQDLVAAVCPYFIGREPGSPILAACKVLTEIASVCAVHLDTFPKRPVVRGKWIISVFCWVKLVKRNVQQIPMLLTAHKLVWLHNVFFDETPNVLIHMNRYTRATE